MAHVTIEQLVSMPLHEIIIEDGGWEIMRVHSGWIYRKEGVSGQNAIVFVPVGATFAMVPRPTNDKRIIDGVHTR